MRRLTTEAFIAKARAIHGNKYDYSKVVYVNAHTKVCIICPEHGEFWQTPNSHLNGSGCTGCSHRRHEKASKTKRDKVLKDYTVTDGIVTLKLTNKGYTKFDEEDSATVLQYNWYYHGVGYARACIKGKETLLHRFILGITSPSTKIDHRDGDGLNNTRSNLRVATEQQNARNKKQDSGKKYKGVYFRKNKGYYESYIQVTVGEKKYLGSYKTEEEAARAYDEAAKKYHKDFARLNFPNG